MRLARARRAVEEHAALEVLTVRQQPLALLTHPDDVVGDPVEHTRREHDGRASTVGRSTKVRPAMPRP